MKARWLGRQPGRIEAIVAAHQAVIVASQDGTVALWPLDGQPPSIVATFEDSEALALARDGAELLIGCSDAVYRWTAGTAPRAIFDQADCVAVAVDARADRIAIAMHDDAMGSEHPIAMLDRAGTPVWTAEVEHWPYAIAIAPDGATVAVACWDGKIARFDAATGARLDDLCTAAAVGPLHDLAWLTATRLAAVSLTGRLVIVDVPTDTLVLQYQDPAGLHAIAAASDGAWLAAAGNGGVVILLEVARGEVVDRIDLSAAGDDDDDDDDGDDDGDDELGMFPSYAEFYDVGGKTAIHALAFHGDVVCAGLEDGSIVELARV